MSPAVPPSASPFPNPHPVPASQKSSRRPGSRDGPCATLPPLRANSAPRCGIRLRSRASSGKTQANHSPAIRCSNRQQFSDGNHNLKLIGLLFEASLELLQVAQALQLAPFTEVHDAKHDDAVVINVRAGLPHALTRELSLDGSHSAKTAEQILLERNVFRFRNGPAIVVIQPQVDFDASNRPYHGAASVAASAATARSRS